mmetsp:Transcript_46299/g.106891  ORF Transcript_46299/g.106891 Transcript_46299/m.106891 type:complete len:358 (+) Transcript_46299:143-1216(+)
MIEPAPQVWRLWEVRLAELLEELRICRRGLETLDVGVLLQELFNAVLHCQLRELLRSLPAHLELGGFRRLLILWRCCCRRGCMRLVVLRACCRPPALERLEGAQRQRSGHGQVVELGNELQHAENAQGLLHVALADVDTESGRLRLPHNNNEVPLSELRLADLLVQRLAAQLALGVEAMQRELPSHPLGVGVALGAHWHDHDLPRIQPEGPLTGVVLNEDCRHALNRAQNGTVDDHRPLEATLELPLAPDDVAFRVSLHGAHKLRLVLFFVGVGLLLTLSPVLQVEPHWPVEVELDRAALEPSLHDVHQRDVDLGAVEGAVAWLQGPLLARGVQGRFELRLRVVPHLLCPQSLLGAR